MSLPQIIILGAGLGGTIAAYEIRDAAKGKAECGFRIDAARHSEEFPPGIPN